MMSDSISRRELLKKASIFGAGSLFLPAFLSSCDDSVSFYEEFDVNFSGDVLVIGAGTAGLMAGHVLNQYGIDFQILEASSVFGGRVKKIDSFADFPIDLGAEWIHTDPSILATLLNNPDETANIDIINYSPSELYIWKNGKLRKRNFFTNFYAEWKFKSSTWFDYLEDYIVPGISGRIIYNSPVTEIDYSGNRVRVTTNESTVYEADRVIVTVPLTILKKNLIDFVPSFPSEKTAAMEKVDMPDGIKVFMEFSERFYPEMLFDRGLIVDTLDGEKLYYDATFGKDTDRNIFALFTVGEPATVYAQFENDADRIAYILNELDEIFGDDASRTYIKHVTQNWSAEPYIQGSYTHYDDYSVQSTLVEPIDNKIFFAGEAYPEDSSTVHGAGQSAYEAVRLILENG
ncbi:MAG: FAD-dependent oxidoreductase [Balneola sp.]|nr:MAG: FAD-dependent oxidoreductase [Balneola sp.]